MGGMRRGGLKIRLRLDLLAGCNRFWRMEPVSVLWIRNVSRRSMFAGCWEVL